MDVSPAKRSYFTCANVWWKLLFHSTVKVPNPPGSGKDIAEGKGAHREMGSEGSRMWGTY